MTENPTTVTRRGLFNVAGKAGIAASLLAPFRSTGGVAWAAQSPKTIKKWVTAKLVSPDDHKITEDHFKMVEEPIPQLKDGDALCEIVMFNLHSAAKDRMTAGTGFTKIGETQNTNYTLARVLQSRDKTFKEGDVIHCLAGWQAHQVINSQDHQQPGYDEASPLVKNLNGAYSPWAFVYRPVIWKNYQTETLMHLIGTSGCTAYFGMRECGPITARDAVAVAGTTGAVGSIAAQIAKIKGAYVVGFGGGAERTKWVTDTLGIPAIDYKAPDVEARIKAAFPNGIDVFCDGIEGPLSETIAKQMNRNGRYFSYGSAAVHSDPSGKYKPVITRKVSESMSDAVAKIVAEKHIHVEAYQAQAHYDQRLESEDWMAQMHFRGKIKPVYTVSEGFDNIPKGICSKFNGGQPYGILQFKLATII